MSTPPAIWPPIETPEKLLREIGPVGTPSPDRIAEMQRAVAENTRLLTRCVDLGVMLDDAMRAGLEECERLRAVVRSLDHIVWDTEDECSALRTERDSARADGRAAGLREALAIVESYQRPSASPEPTELDHIVSVIGSALREAEVSRG